MALALGVRLGPYEIAAQIGVGVKECPTSARSDSIRPASCRN